MFVRLVNEGGGQPTPEQVDGFCNEIVHDGLSVSSAIMRTRLLYERVSDYLLNSKLAVRDAGSNGLSLTPTALALVKGLEARAARPRSSSASISGTFTDDEALGELLEWLADKDDVLLVDAYVQGQALKAVAGLGTVKRVLTTDARASGDASWDDRKRRLQVSVFGTDTEIRFVQQRVIHDRWVLLAEGTAMMLGGSLNTSTDTTSIEVSSELSETERARYDALWDEAEVLPVLARAEVTALDRLASEDGPSVEGTHGVDASVARAPESPIELEV